LQVVVESEVMPVETTNESEAGSSSLGLTCSGSVGDDAKCWDKKGKVYCDDRNSKSKPCSYKVSDE